MKKILAQLIEWIRPAGLCFGFFAAYYWGSTAVERLHILTPFMIIALSGVTGLESLFLGKTASAKIGYTPSRPYQIQSGLNHLTVAIVVLISWGLHWGLYADAALLSVCLLSFSMSAANHAWQAIVAGNRKPVNFMRPILMTVLLIGALPILIRALQSS